MNNANDTYKLGDTVSVDYFGLRLEGVLSGFSGSGVSVAVKFTYKGVERDGAWLTLDAFYAGARLVKAAPANDENTVGVFQGHTYLKSA